MNIYNVLVTVGIALMIVALIAFVAATGALIIAYALNHYYI